MENEENKKATKGFDLKNISQAIILAGILIAGAILLKGSSPTPSPLNQEEETLSFAQLEIRPVSSEDHLLGNKEAELFLIEYSDLECPFCKTFHNTTKKLITEKKEVALVFRHYPVPELHQKAETEALATECAFEQGGDQIFWQYLDAVFEKTKSNDGLDLTELPKIAKELNLNVPLFNSCLESEKYKERIVKDKEEGNTLGFQIFGRGLGTPSSFLVKDGKVVDIIVGAQPYEMLLQTIEKHL